VKPSRSPAEIRFSQLWEAHACRVLAYASRHTDQSGVEDVVAETFLVAWRRLDDVPDDPLPWLLVVARNTAVNRRRSIQRAHLVELEMTRAARAACSSEAADVPVQARDEVLRAMGRLTPTEREALFLIAWDGLTLAQGAQVLDCSVYAFTKRVSRARARLSVAFAEDDMEDVNDMDDMTVRRAR
jgi:RNA polymerase sigma factor (sigma-70 family)